MPNPLKPIIPKAGGPSLPAQDDPDLKDMERDLLRRKKGPTQTEPPDPKTEEEYKFPARAALPPFATIKDKKALVESIEALPICDIEGGLPIDDKYLADVHRIFYTPVRLTKDGQDWVFFTKPGEEKSLRPAVKSSLLNPNSDELLQRIEISQNNFPYKLEFSVLGGIFQKQYPSNYELCRSDKKEADGGYRIWVYGANRLLTNSCGEKNPALLRPLPSIRLEPHEMSQLVALGNLSNAEYCIADDWSGKLFIASNLTTVDLLKEKITKSGLFKPERKKAILDDIENAIGEDRDATWKQNLGLWAGVGVLGIFGAQLGLAYAMKKQQDRSIALQRTSVELQQQVTAAMETMNKKPAITDFANDRVEEMRQKLVEDPDFDIVGRDAEARILLETLARPEYANTVVTGETGTGKDVVVDKAALKIARGDSDVPSVLRDKKIWRVDPTDIQAGTQFRGSFADKVSIIKAQMEGGNVAYFPELPDQMSAGRALQSGAESLVVLAKEILTRPWSRWVGTGTSENTEMMMQLVPDLRRRLKPQFIGHMHPADILRAMTQQVSREYAKKMNATIQPATIEAATRLGIAYLLPEQGIPPFDAAKNALMDAISYAKRGNGTGTVLVTPQHVIDALQERLEIAIDPNAGTDLFASRGDNPYRSLLEDSKGGPKGPKGGGGPQGGSPPAPAGGGGGAEGAGSAGEGEPGSEARGEPDDSANRTCLVEERAPRFGRAFEKVGGVATVGGALSVVSVLKDTGKLSDQQSQMVHNTMLAGMVAVDGGFLVSLGAGMIPAYVGQQGGEKLAEKAGVENPIVKGLVGLWTGLAAFEASEWALRHSRYYNEWRSASAVSTRQLAGNVSNAIGQAGYAIEESLTRTWQNFSTGLRNYGKEVVAGLSMLGENLATGGLVFANVAARLVTPIIMINGLDAWGNKIPEDAI